MSISPYDAMQAAVDIVASSPHPANKIAATLFGDDWQLSRTNYWPRAIIEKIGTDRQIGNSSGTIHAETACILDAPAATRGASLCVTDPFCPNCAKNIAEAGINTIYIDHKGFDKDFFKRRSDHFDSMSMQICEKAGISVFELWRKDKKLVPILEIAAGYKPAEDSPIEQETIERADDKTFRVIIDEASRKLSRRKFAACFVEDDFGARSTLIARGHAVRGYSMARKDDMRMIEQADGKYSFIQEPVNRLLMACARRGLAPLDGFFYASQIPTSREQVNLIGAGIGRITIGDITRSRDADGIAAMRLLRQKKIIRYS